MTPLPSEKKKGKRIIQNVAYESSAENIHLATSASTGPRFQKLSSIYSDCAVRMRGFVTGVSAESGPLSSPEQLL